MPRGADGSRAVRRKLRFLLATYLGAAVVLVLLAEAGFRLFWHPPYWIQCERLLVGSGQTGAGRKWWPETTYRVESAEFRVRFTTDARGYRARPEPARSAHPYRVAFVGDSFTEGAQVDYAKTFCALIERGLAGAAPGREVVCENFGVAATGLFDYWHRITHDVLRPAPPDALVLCLYPGNDFSDPFPDDGFEADGRPRAEYYTDPGWAKHLMTWLNLKSKFGHYVLRTALMHARRMAPPAPQGPWLWHADPAVAASAPEAPAIVRSRALLSEIDRECRRAGTKLCILVVGPVTIGPTVTYFEKEGRSPLGLILADWGLDIPVIDTAIAAVRRPDHRGLVFPRDGHLNEAGHAFVAADALPPLRAALFPAREIATDSPAPATPDLLR